MKNPYPINLMTAQEVRAHGWFAEARDADGHLISCIAGPGVSSDQSLGEFMREYAGEGGCIVTAWPLRTTHPDAAILHAEQQAEAAAERAGEDRADG